MSAGSVVSKSPSARRGQLRGGFDHSPDNDDLANALVGSTALDSIESPTPHGAVSRVTSRCRSTSGQLDRPGSVNNRKGIGDGGGDDRRGRVGERGSVLVGQDDPPVVAPNQNGRTRVLPVHGAPKIARTQMAGVVQGSACSRGSVEPSSGAPGP